jgi:hypothetical protein
MTPPASRNPIRRHRRASRSLLAIATSAFCLLALAGAAPAGQGGALTRLLLTPGEETGFVPDGPVHAQATARAYAGGFPARRAAVLRELRRVGFRAALYQLQTGAGGAQGTSAVVEVDSPAHASTLLRFKVALNVRQNPGATITRYTVRGIPGALGFTAVSPGGGGASNAQWAQGDCVVEVGDYRPAGSGDLSRPVIAGARAIHRRTLGRC